MNVIKCANGHFFDGDSYIVCPHCGAPAADATKTQNTSTEQKKTKKTVGLFKKNLDKSNESGHSTADNTVHVVNTYDNGFDDNSTTEEIKDMNHFYDDLSLAQMNLNIQNSVDTFEQEQDQSQKEEVKKNGHTIDIWHSGSETEVKKEEIIDLALIREEEQEKTDSSSLAEAVRNVTASNDGKTMSYFSIASQTQTNTEQVKHNDPVVGWLVCIHGPHFGMAFNIYAGMNSIGRSKENKIVIAGDNAVSREKHALITYEPKHRQFYIKPGDSSGLTYVNDEYVTENKVLNARDQIELGGSHFIFVPLCSEDFSWEEYLN